MAVRSTSMSVRITSNIPKAKSSVDSAFNRAAEIIGGMAESYAKGDA